MDDVLQSHTTMPTGMMPTGDHSTAPVDHWASLVKAIIAASKTGLKDRQRTFTLTT